MAFDAGRLNCTFEPAFELGPVVDSPTTINVAVAMTESGEAIYAWVAPDGVAYRVQSPTGTLGAAQLDADAGSVPFVTVSARGQRALLAYSQAGTSSFETRTRRYATGSGWAAQEVVDPAPGGLGALYAELEADGSATLWRQDTYAMPPLDEFTSVGTAPFGPPRTLANAGFRYSGTRMNGTTMSVLLRDFGSTPELLFTTASGDSRTAMTGATPTGNDFFHSALAEDGTAVVGGVFAVNSTQGLSAIVRTGGTLSPAERVSEFGDGGLSYFRSMGVLAGPGGRAAVIWWDSARILVSRRVANAWTAPVVIANTEQVVPRYTRINDARGLVQYATASGGAAFIEVGVDGYVGPETPTIDFLGAAYGTEFAAGGSNAAAIKTTTAADGGTVVIAAQCR